MLPHDSEFAALKEKLLTMSSLAASSVSNAVKALVERNDDLARQVEQTDDQLDALEVELDELAIVLLSRGPVASDLRLITVAMKITHNLERVGDEATTIARRSLDLSQEPQLKAYVDIPRRATMAMAISVSIAIWARRGRIPSVAALSELNESAKNKRWKAMTATNVNTAATD